MPRTIHSQQQRQKAYLERVLGYFYPESDNSIALRYLEVRSRGHKVKGLDDYKLGDYVKNYPMGTYALNFCQTIQGIPVYHDVGERLDTTGYNNAPEGLIDDAWKKASPSWVFQIIVSSSWVMIALKCLYAG